VQRSPGSYYNNIDGYYHESFDGRHIPSVSINTSDAGSFQQPQDLEALSEDALLEGDPISPLRRTSDSLRRLLSKRSSSSSGISRNSSLRTGPSLRSQLSTRSSLSSRWSFKRSPRVRAGDEEEGHTRGRLSEDIEPLELESIAADAMGPFELYSLSHEERRNILLRPTQSGGKMNIAPHKRIAESLFGRQLCSPQYLGLRRVYMSQIDKKLNTALYESAVANPNPAVWPKPFAYLVGHLGIVSSRLTPSSSVTTFVLSHMDDFTAMIRKGDFATDIPEQQQDTTDREKAAMAAAMGFNDPDNYSPWHQKIVHEWMLFSIEAWTMLDLSRSIDNRQDLLASQTFCESSIEELLKPHLPANLPTSYPTSGSTPETIAPAQLTASMLHDWKGVRFKWTTNITDHLRLDAQEKVVKLYANVAYCHLHSIAKENSSLL
jgi:hypothetical protein